MDIWADALIAVAAILWIASLAIAYFAGASRQLHECLDKRDETWTLEAEDYLRECDISRKKRTKD